MANQHQNFFLLQQHAINEPVNERCEDGQRHIYISLTTAGFCHKSKQIGAVSKSKFGIPRPKNDSWLMRWPRQMTLTLKETKVKKEIDFEVQKLDCQLQSNTFRSYQSDWNSMFNNLSGSTSLFCKWNICSKNKSKYWKTTPLNNLQCNSVRTLYRSYNSGSTTSKFQVESQFWLQLPKQLCRHMPPIRAGEVVVRNYCHKMANYT